jgi:hypothetical protein
MSEAIRCAARVTELADLWCRMDAHEGQAAWAQAIGAVVAILASAGFAIWVPLHMRSIEDVALCHRAKRSLLRGYELLTGMVVAARELHAELRVNDETLRLWEVKVRQLRMLLDAVPRTSLGFAAVAIIDDLDQRCVVVGTLLAAAAKGPRDDLDGIAADLLIELQQEYDIAKRLAVMRDAGGRILELPDDDPALAGMG